MNGLIVDFAVVALLGALVGAGELVSRYRDAPEGALLNGSAAWYIFINIAASVVGLGLIRAFD